MRGNISSLHKLANFHPSGPSPLPLISPLCIEKQTGPFLQRFPWSHFECQVFQQKKSSTRNLRPLSDGFVVLFLRKMSEFKQAFRATNHRQTDMPCGAFEQSNIRKFKSSTTSHLKLFPIFTLTFNFFNEWRQSSHCNCNCCVYLFQFQVCSWRRRHHKTNAIHNETAINNLLNACNIDDSNEITSFHFAQITAFIRFILSFGMAFWSYICLIDNIHTKLRLY